jgi:Rap guanine nucleotide exchange factor 2
MFFNSDGVHVDDPLAPPHTPPGTGLAQTTTNLYHSKSNPDLTSLYCYDDLRANDYPEHVLKVYKADQTCKYLLIHKETTAHEVNKFAERQRYRETQGEKDERGEEK